jgi:hypothetical protein
VSNQGLGSIVSGFEHGQSTSDDDGHERLAISLVANHVSLAGRVALQEFGQIQQVLAFETERPSGLLQQVGAFGGAQAILSQGGLGGIHVQKLPEFWLKNHQKQMSKTVYNCNWLLVFKLKCGLGAVFMG